MAAVAEAEEEEEGAANLGLLAPRKPGVLRAPVLPALMLLLLLLLLGLPLPMVEMAPASLRVNWKEKSSRS